MAIFTIGEAMGDFANLATVVDQGSLVPVSGSTTSFVLGDALGNTLTYSGTALVIQGEAPNLSVQGGQFTGLVATNAGAESLLTVTGLDVSASIFSSVFGSLGFLAAYLFLTDGNDTFNGSSNADMLIAGAGRDRVRGEAGADFIDGGKGNDKLWGGRGVDTFYFEKSSGKDTILDFTDTSGRSDDVIMVSRTMYRTMEMAQETGGVRLFLGNAEVFVKGWTMEAVDQGDFILV